MNEVNWKKIFQEWSTLNVIKRTKEYLCFITITPFPLSKQYGRWSNIGKCNDILKKYSDAFIIVKGFTKKDIPHYHCYCYMTPLCLSKMKNSALHKHTNIDYKLYSDIKTILFVADDPDQEITDATDELVDEGKGPTTEELWERIGWNRCLKACLCKGKTPDKYLSKDLSKYMLENVKGELRKYQNYIVKNRAMPLKPPVLKRQKAIRSGGSVSNRMVPLPPIADVVSEGGRRLSRIGDRPDNLKTVHDYH